MKKSPTHKCQNKNPQLDILSCPLCLRIAPENKPTHKEGIIYSCPSRYQQLEIQRKIANFIPYENYTPHDCTKCNKKNFTSELCFKFHLLECNKCWTCDNCGYKIQYDWKRKRPNLPDINEMISTHTCYTAQVCHLCNSWVIEGIPGHVCLLQTYGLLHHLPR